MGLPNPSKIKAAKGNVCHKALECLAFRKLCLQNSLTTFTDEGLGTLHIDDCTPDNLIELSYRYYKKLENYHDWDDDIDLEDCRIWMYKALNFQNGNFDPRNRKVISPEQYFDFPIEQPWAKYHYELPDGTIMDDYLRLKGSVDLLTEVRPGVFELIDWKTGATNKDFSTGKTKDFYSLHKDPQLRLYHYAIHKLYPEVDEIIITIYFIRLGGPISLLLCKEDLPETERMIRKQFEKVKRTTKPRLNPGPSWSDHPHEKIAAYKCYKLCAFSKPSKENPAISTCQFMKEKIEEIGIDRVTVEFGDLKKISSYGSGGGAIRP